MAKWVCCDYRTPLSVAKHDASISDKPLWTPSTATVSANKGSSIILMPDTGPAASIMPEEISQKYYANEPLTAPTLKLVSYIRDPIYMLGCLPVTVNVSLISVQDESYIVKKGIAILGRDFSVSLRLHSHFTICNPGKNWRDSARNSKWHSNCSTRGAWICYPSMAPQTLRDSAAKIAQQDRVAKLHEACHPKWSKSIFSGNKQHVQVKWMGLHYATCRIVWKSRCQNRIAGTLLIRMGPKSASSGWSYYHNTSSCPNATFVQSFTT